MGEAFIEIQSQKLKFQVTTTGSPILSKDMCVALKLIKRVDAVNLQNININTEDYAKKLKMNIMMYSQA